MKIINLLKLCVKLCAISISQFALMSFPETSEYFQNFKICVAILKRFRNVDHNLTSSLLMNDTLCYVAIKMHIVTFINWSITDCSHIWVSILPCREDTIGTSAAWRSLTPRLRTRESGVVRWSPTSRMATEETAPRPR